LRRGAEIYPILIDIKEDEVYNKTWLSNWREVSEYIPYSRFQLNIFKIHHILKKVASDLKDNKYFCGICRLIRFELMSKILNKPTFHFYEKIRASVDGISLNCSSFCPDSIDLDSLANNSLTSILPIFTPIIGFGQKKLEDLALKISPNLKKIDYCPFKPINQEFDKGISKKIYDNLKIDKLLEDSIEKRLEIKVF
jgi:adenylyl- and sulfurtransferase ThiI